LLGRGFEIADAFSFRAQHLDDVRHVFGLRGERRAKRLCPVEMIGEHLNDIGEARQRLHR
jgi:hypothetical protein